MITVLLIVLCLPITVHAKDQAVTITSASAAASKVTVSGTTTAAAVMVQVRDASDNILGMQTLGVVDGKFSGDVTDLTLAADTDYTVYVADYEGGAWETETVKYETPTTAITTAATTATTTAATTATTTEATTAASTSDATTTAASTAADDAGKKSPKTADYFPLYGMLGIAGVSLAGMMAAAKKRGNR